ncbi:MAG: segregation/condensation protein A [Opitutales bacterium]|nr:segregation/condensation protein A [Opitutales bacterium]
MSETPPIPEAGSEFPYFRDAKIRDGLLEDEAPVIRLSRFEGPLDLLLFLIRKNEIDIYDIPIESVTKQYLEILRGNERMNLDIAGEFFVMAATLMYIKSRVLLPSSETIPDKNELGGNEDEELDPRWQLVRQLIQYKRLKESSEHLADLIAERQGFMTRNITPDEAPEQRPIAPVGRMDLWNVFNLVLKRLADRILPGEIQGDSVTIAQRMEDILERVRTEKSFSFTSLLPEKLTVAVLVSTFLACLELARLGQIIVRQDEVFAEIYCDAREDGSDPFPSELQDDAELDLGI